MDCFIKKIFLGKADEQCHRQFVRFGKGNYSNRAAMSLSKNEKVKVGGSFEWASDFVLLASELCDANFSGIILSKDEINEIAGMSGKKKAGVYEYNFCGKSSDVRKISEKAYCMLLDAEGSGISLKIKKKLPKPGKSGNLKIDDKFCQLETGLECWQKIKDAFFWDIPECKKAKIRHDYVISGVISPEGEKDFEKIRILARRKGKLVRKLAVDNREETQEIEIEV